ncbi:MAG: class I SAM-dependent methyltransferase [Pseudodesulfovibrio sp.]
MQQDLGSFRDRSGYVYSDADKIVRTIMPCYQETWQGVIDSGLIDEALEEGLLVPFEECAPIPGSWKTLEVEAIPFISYPYEWSFSQLKDAALLTLDLQKRALERATVLKDATAYNVQFKGARPVFIDLLSFEPWKQGDTWQAYRQFCSHFLAPLALAAKSDLRLAQLSRQWIDGIPIDVTVSMLPWKTRFSPGILMHLILHASMQKKYADPRSFKGKKNSSEMTIQKMLDINASLENTVRKLRFPAQETEWGDYYNDTNYTDDGTKAKLEIIESVASQHAGALAIDLGANTGRFSRPLANHFGTVISADIDPAAVDRHYCYLLEHGPDNILPIVLDLSSPSPSLGWASQERKSFTERCEADMLIALALCHHLFFTVGTPFAQIATYFASLLRPGGMLVCEFVPRDDSQVQRMLSARDDIFDDYTVEEFNQAFDAAGFEEQEVRSMPDSLRSIYVFKKAE